MPWRERCKVELRLEFVRRHLEGEKMAALCREFGISRPTGYLWVKRFQDERRISSLKDRSHRPKSIWRKTDESIERRVCELRERHGWGGKKLSIVLSREGIDVPVITINRILKRNGKVNNEESNLKALKRFERESPNELWQMDFKGPMGGGQAKCEPLSVIDDRSRFVTGLVAVQSKRTEEVRAAMRRIFCKYGVPEAILLDHGTPWYSNSNNHGLSRFSVWLMNQDISLYFSGICHPQTQGKVERFHRTLAQAVRRRGAPERFSRWGKLLGDIRFEYNHIRPHEALDMNTPASQYEASTRSYQAKPKPFDYGDASRIAKLDSHGMLSMKGRRYFVCQALRDQYVKLDEIEGRMLATYRTTPLREIDLSTGKSFAL